MLSKKVKKQVEEIRGKRWYYCDLQPNGHFNGCVKNYRGDRGIVTVIFALHEAYVIWTDSTMSGTLSAKKVVGMLQKGKADVNDTEGYDDIGVLARYSDSCGEVAEDVLEKTGLRYETQGIDILQNLKALSELDEVVMAEMKTGYDNSESLPIDLVNLYRLVNNY